jgi:hypothetical protein
LGFVGMFIFFRARPKIHAESTPMNKSRIIQLTCPSLASPDGRRRPVTALNPTSRLR